VSWWARFGFFDLLLIKKQNPPPKGGKNMMQDASRVAGLK